jgi:hypothetical protein
MGHTKEPGEQHHKLLTELKGVCGRYGLQGVTDAEQVAILAQLIGRKIHDLDERQYDTGEIMQAVSRNIVQGNNAAGGGPALIGMGGKPS